MSTMSQASTGARIRAPRARTLALLCWRARRAVYSSWHNAALTPWTLLAEICSPCPDPPITMPISARPADDMAGTSGAEGRVVYGLLPVGAQVVDFVAELPQMGHYRQLERVAGVIIGDGDLH